MTAMQKNVVTIGGGTGTFVVLSGLRNVPQVFPTAIVSSADDGGSTGRLRDAYGILPPGDARQALVALAEQDTMLRELFAHRFAKGDIAGHNLGNLFLTALANILGSEAAALEEASRILRVRGRVLSVSERPGTLIATLADGTTLTGEHAIDERARGRARIVQLSMSDGVWISQGARSAIMEADLIVLGPGDLYTSTIAALVTPGVSQAIKESGAKIAYIMNLFSKAGQTEGYSALDHVREIERYALRSVDAIFMNDNGISEEAITLYEKEGEYRVEDDLGGDSRVRRLPLVSVTLVPPVAEDPVPRSLVRHDGDKIAAALNEFL